MKLASCKNALNSRVFPVLVLIFVALWFTLRSDLFYVLPCAILFLCFSVLLALRLPRLGKRELILVLLVRLFDLCFFRFVSFLFLLVSGKGCGLWLWHSLDFSLTLFFITVFLLQLNIRETCLYNFDPLKPHFYIVKLGFTGVYIIFLFLPKKRRLWVLVRSASQRRF